MIDLVNEDVITLADATKYLPKRRRGKRPHPTTIFRWAQCGVKGIRLETIRVGGTLCTSTEALQRFCERCTDPSTPPSRTNKASKKPIDNAERELRAAGI